MIKTWAMAACLAVAALVVGVANAQQQLSPSERAARFTSECTSSGATSELCQCVWDGVQTRMTAEEYASFDAAIRSQQIHPSLAKFELIVGVCNGTSRVTASNPEAFPGHTSANFMNGCVPNGVSQAVCACIMNEVERTMSLQTFTELDRLMSWGRAEEHPARPQFIGIVQACVQRNQ